MTARLTLAPPGKRFISALKDLRYLDDRPVFEDERRRCDAWGRVWDATGDAEKANAEEREELKRIKQDKADKEKRRIKMMDDMITNARKEAAQREAEGLSFSREEIVGKHYAHLLPKENADPNSGVIKFVDVEELD